MSKPFSVDEQRKFEKIKALVMGVIQRMDNKKGLNIKRYETFFNLCEKDPDVFRNWDILHSNELDSCPTIMALPFEEPSMTQIKNAADFLGIELENYIYYRQNDPRGIRSKMKVPVRLCAHKKSTCETMHYN